MTSLIDTHAHVDQLTDLDAALARAASAGVTDIVAMSVDLASMKKTLQIAGLCQTPKVHAAFGVHPGNLDAVDLTDAFDWMRQNMAKAVAIGETGLDFWYKWVRKDGAQRQKQQQSFLVHLEMAVHYHLPIVIHSRGAWAEALEMTVAAGVQRALFHWYSGPVDVLEKIVRAGYYVSTSLSVAYSPESQRAMAAAPLERILIETDSPVTYRDESRPSEPRDVARTLKALAALKAQDELSVLEQVNHNAKLLFGI